MCVGLRWGEATEIVMGRATEIVMVRARSVSWITFKDSWTRDRGVQCDPSSMQVYTQVLGVRACVRAIVRARECSDVCVFVRLCVRLHMFVCACASASACAYAYAYACACACTRTGVTMLPCVVSS
eukprot:4020460-Pleurochrysis_carterae.AAC.1